MRARYVPGERLLRSRTGSAVESRLVLFRAVPSFLLNHLGEEPARCGVGLDLDGNSTVRGGLGIFGYPLPRRVVVKGLAGAPFEVPAIVTRRAVPGTVPVDQRYDRERRNWRGVGPPGYLGCWCGCRGWRDGVPGLKGCAVDAS